MPYALDLSCVDDLTETMAEATGLRALAESCLRRLTTPRGALLDEDDYGLDVRRFIHKPMTRVVQLAIPGMVRQELEKEDGVLAVDVDVVQQSARRMGLEITVASAEGPLELLLEVDSDGALKASATIEGVLLELATLAKEAA